MLRLALCSSLLALAGCATAPVTSLVDRIPPPPKDAAAAQARCGEREDTGLSSLMDDLAAYQRRENNRLFKLMSAAHAQPESAADYAKLHPQAAQALVDRQTAITQEARELDVRENQDAGAALRELNQVLSGVDGAERSGLGKCLRVQQGGQWIPDPACAAPVRAEAEDARVAAADRYLTATQGVWQSWRTDTDKTIAGWTVLPADTPDPESTYVQMALSGYRQTQDLTVRQLMSDSTNLCALAVQAVKRPEPKP